MFGHAVPAPVVHNNCVWFLPGPAHFVQILVMVKWIASGPVNQMYVRILVALSIEIKGFARV